MANTTYPSLPTPQVILSLDMVDALLFFEDARNQRAGFEGKTVSDFINKFADKQAFVFTSNEKGNLINFRSSWGREESGQSSFRLEILDAGSKFEDTFFGNFSTGGVSYAEALLQFIANKDINLKRYTEELAEARGAAVGTGQSQQNVARDSMADLDSFVDARVQRELNAVKQSGALKYRVQAENAIWDGSWETYNANLERWKNPMKQLSIHSLPTWLGGTAGVGAGAYLGGDAPSQPKIVNYEDTGSEFSATQAQLNAQNNKHRADKTVAHWRNVGWDLEGHPDIKDAEEFKSLLRRKYLAEYEKLFLFEEGFSDSYYDLSQEIRRLGGLPFTQKFWISFGIGNDISAYPPAQLANLVKIEYGLNANDVRTFVLHFVPTPGMLSIEAHPHLINTLRGSNRVEYQATQLLVDQRGNSLSPLTAVENIVEEAYSLIMGTDTQVHCLTFDIEEGIRKKINECKASTLYQHLKSTNPKLTMTSKELLQWDGYKDLSKYISETKFGGSALPVAGGVVGQGAAGARFNTPVNGERFRLGLAPQDALSKLLRNVEKKSHHYLSFPTENKTMMLSRKGNSYYALDSGFRNNFDTFNFYLKVLSKFFTSLGFEFKASFYNEKNVKVQWFPFAKSLDGGINTLNRGTISPADRMTSRRFVRLAMRNFIVEIGMVRATPALLKDGIDAALGKLDSRGDVPLTVNYSETGFLEAWNNQDPLGDREEPINSVFIINRGLWGALVDGKGHSHISKNFSDLPAEKIAKAGRFVNAYNTVVYSDIPVGNVAGLFNPYSYLSSQNRQLSGDKFLSTFDSLGKFNTVNSFENHLRSNRIPLFNYGFTNSNVLDFNFDLNMWWAQFLRVVPESLKNVLLTASIGDPKKGFTNTAFKTALDLAKSDLSGERLEKYLNELWEESYSGFVNGNDPESAKHNEVFEFNDISKIAVNSPTVSPAQIQHVYSIADPAERIAAKIAIFPTKEEFKSRMKQCILLILNTADYAAKFKSQTWNDNKSLDDILSIQDRMATQGGFRGTITTLPLFQIMTPSMIGRKALLYFVEPQIQSNDKLNNDIPFKTWLSGEYFILGYEAVIADGEITSKFDILKKPYLKNVSIIE